MNAKLTNQEIYERVYAAIGERRLPPGTKLSEERLAQIFQASRTRIREVLLRLAQELIVETHPNRGAFVASPTAEDTRHVFAVRRALERAIVAELCTRFAGQPVAALRAHLDAEARARAGANRTELARLTGEFHVILAAATGNRIFAEDMRRLVALTSLIIAQYESHDSGACAEHEHHDIIKAIEAGDARRAERLMLQHLEHVESAIHVSTTETAEVNFERIFGLDEVAPPKAKRAGR